MSLPARAAGLRHAPSAWTLEGLSGRLVEISGAEDSAALTVALGLVRQAQLLGEPAAWVTPATETFFPPDAAAGGVDLAALPVVRVPDPRALPRAADQLARSGGFGLVVVDLGAARLPLAALSRLMGLAGRHGVLILFLTDKSDRAPSIGSLVSLRGHARRRRTGPDEFACEVAVLKDKRRPPGWTHTEVCGGPPGLM
ncbi:MAG: DNA recombination/repair protein RecA [Planctomycetes bacterium]|nr:DNA recombination/repair protein RecA [Planctomycetota bacterium]